MRIRELEHARGYCLEVEKIEGFEKAKLDNFKGWHCHHRLETHNSDGQERPVFITSKELKALGMYYNRPPEELIFMTSSDHLKLHNSGNHNHFTGKHLTDEHKRKAVATRMKNGSYNVSDSTRKKLSESHKGKICNDNRIRCQCIETGIIYESFSEASRQTGQNMCSIRKSCLGLVNPRKFHWKFYD